MTAAARDLGKRIGRILLAYPGLDARRLEAEAGPPPLRILSLDRVVSPRFNLDRLAEGK